ncbi:hypothetical protein MRB53_011428 [Persea americana]|uniref:Uncharacterized protein n=1 Tax=Persea americana TaxID=3435 RepID=A0ACC2LVN7_PERAE|nr:hypothetical protein MRB53_011428 [Persea americana]
MEKETFKDTKEEAEVEEEEEGRWLKHYFSLHQILLVGEGDFSFSLCLAKAFGSASNLVTTSLDNYDVVTKKYSQAKSNIQNLVKLGATVLHGVDATKMKLHTDLSMRKFDRIIFNFPHAGFYGKEDEIRLIELHRNLVQGFFKNASQMLCPNGEVHVSHKTSAPYDRWNLEELAWKCSLSLKECVNFEKADYPGYNNKRGDGAECDKPFRLGECSTFKFRINTKKAKMMSEATAFYICGQSPLDITEAQHIIQTGGTLDGNQFGRARSFDGTDHLICYPQMSNPSSMQDFFGIPYGNTRISSTNYHLRSVRCEQMDHTIALPEIPGTRHWNLRHPGENDHSLSFHYWGVTPALPVMRGHFNHTDTINVTSECRRIFGDYLLHNDEMFGRTDYDFRSAIQGFLTNGYEMYMKERPEGTRGYVRSKLPKGISTSNGVCTSGIVLHLSVVSVSPAFFYTISSSLPKRVLVSRDVIFEEEKQWDWDVSYEKQIVVDLEWGDGDGENEEGVSENGNGENTDGEVGETRDEGVREEEDGSSESEERVRELRQSRERHPPTWMGDYVSGEGLFEDEVHMALVLSSDPFKLLHLQGSAAAEWKMVVKLIDWSGKQSRKEKFKMVVPFLHPSELIIFLNDG